MENDILTTMVSVAPSFFSAFTACAAVIIAKRQEKFNRETEINKNTPYLYPVDHRTTKDTWERLYYLAPEIDSVIPKRYYADLSDDEKVFCDFIKEHKQEAIIYNLNDKLYVVTNGGGDDIGYVIDHNSAQITFKNYGALITKMHIDFISVRSGEELCRYEGKESSYYTDIILPNGTIDFIVDAIECCKIGIEEYVNYKDWNMFKDLTPNTIPYNEYEIQITLWNQYNQEFTFKIKLYKKGRRFYRDVIQLKNR